MNPFLLALVQAGIISQADAERMNRSLDPDAARAWAEQQLAIAMQNGLSTQQTRLVDMVRRTNGSLSARQLDTFWAAEDDRLYQAVLPTLRTIASEQAIGLAVSMGNESMWQLINEQMLGWVSDYYINPDAAAVGSIPNLNLTSRTQFAQAFTEWQRGDLGGTADGLPQLISSLQDTFGPARSEIIAVTETTRILQGAGQSAADESDFLEIAEWQTAADEIVCPYCGPMHMQQRHKTDANYPGGVHPPPLHPRCRCREVWLTKAVAGMQLPPEERWRFNADANAEYQRNQRAARREPNAIRTLIG